MTLVLILSWLAAVGAGLVGVGAVVRMAAGRAKPDDNAAMSRHESFKLVSVDSPGSVSAERTSISGLTVLPADAHEICKTGV